jgi:hypothetical protein
MASTEFTGRVTPIPTEWANEVNALVFDVFGAASTVIAALEALGIGSLGLQDQMQVAIGGGSIDGVTIGANSPVAIAAASGTLENVGSSGTSMVNRDWVLSTATEQAEALLDVLLPTTGDIMVRGVHAQRMIAGDNATILMASSASPTGLTYATLTQLAEYNPTDDPNLHGSVGDILVRTVTQYARLPVGDDGMALIADSSQPQGIRWALISGGGGGVSSPLTTKGDLFTFTTVAARLPVGTTGQLLTSDPTALSGLSWQTFEIPSLDSLPYDLNFSMVGLLASASVVAVNKLLRALNIPASFAGSISEALTPPTTGTSRFILSAEGIGDLAHIDFTTGVSTGTITQVAAAGPISLPAGTTLIITTDSSVFDGTVRNVCFGVSATATID